MRALPRERPAALTAPPDGQSLDAIIGELQSNYGVPAYPQEYRITIKVAEEKTPAAVAGGNGAAAPKATPSSDSGPKREKAPAAPRVVSEGSEEAAPETAKARRKRNRRRRGRGGRPGGPAGGPSSGPSSPPPPPS